MQGVVVPSLSRGGQVISRARHGALALLVSAALPCAAALAQQQSAPAPQAQSQAPAQAQGAQPQNLQKPAAPAPQAQSQPAAQAPGGVQPQATTQLPPAGPENAEQVLLEKANYWRLKDRPDLAKEALNELLKINPNNPDALFQFGMLSVQDNKPAEAQRYLAKLQQVAPNDPHIADLQSAIRTGKIGTNDLNEARRLAQAGQLDEAIKKYQGNLPRPAAVRLWRRILHDAGWNAGRLGRSAAGNGARGSGIAQ